MRPTAASSRGGQSLKVVPGHLGRTGSSTAGKKEAKDLVLLFEDDDQQEDFMFAL
jgi:hypothetical protein